MCRPQYIVTKPSKLAFNWDQPKSAQAVCRNRPDRQIWQAVIVTNLLALPRDYPAKTGLANIQTTSRNPTNDIDNRVCSTPRISFASASRLANLAHYA